MKNLYSRTEWLDHMVDDNGTVVQQGTPVNAPHLNNIEEGILRIDGEITFTESELDTMLDDVFF